MICTTTLHYITIEVEGALLRTQMRALLQKGLNTKAISSYGDIKDLLTTSFI